MEKRCSPTEKAVGCSRLGIFSEGEVDPKVVVANKPLLTVPCPGKRRLVT